MAEVASIFQSEAERLRNKPKRQAVPNPSLEADMVKYRAKIDRKFSESYINHNYKLFREPEKPLRLKYAVDNGRRTVIDAETAKLLTSSW